MSHTPTPWATLNVPPINRRFHAKLGPLLISRGSDEDILFAQKAINSHDRLVEALRVCLDAEKERRADLKPGAPATTYTEARIATITAALEGL